MFAGGVAQAAAFVQAFDEGGGGVGGAVNAPDAVERAAQCRAAGGAAAQVLPEGVAGGYPAAVDGVAVGVGFVGGFLAFAVGEGAGSAVEGFRADVVEALR